MVAIARMNEVQSLASHEYSSRYEAFLAYFSQGSMALDVYKIHLLSFDSSLGLVPL
jgi:hypothetical protein